MYILAVPFGLPKTVREPLFTEFAGRGSLGVVDFDAIPTQPSGPETVSVAATRDEMRWNGPVDSVGQLLDRLAADCHYAVIQGEQSDSWPTLQVESGVIQGDFLDESQSVEENNPAEIVDALERTEPWESLESLVDRVKSHHRAERSGAIATFTGRVRTKDGPEDTATEYLEFERYGEIANERLDRIERELTDRDGVFAVETHHRTGVIRAGEDIVFVVVLAGHRGQAFETVEDGINRLKAEVPIFKKEVTVDDEFWMNARP